MNIHFPCPTCERPAYLVVDPTIAAPVWQCPGCDHLLTPSEPTETPAPPPCIICGNHELYKKKDFPHWLGLSILTFACVGSIVPYYLYLKWLTWTILLGSAAFDGLLYLWVGDVVVCYRCNAHYRKFVDNPAFKPHDLGIAERYRQEKIRREQLRAQTKM